MMHLDWKYSQNSVPDAPFPSLENIDILQLHCGYSTDTGTTGTAFP